MCTEVYQHFEDPDCRHKEYQNTFPCYAVRRCGPNDDQLLAEPVFIPTSPPKILPGLLSGCKVRKATRPVNGKCRCCRRRQLLLQNPSSKLINEAQRGRSFSAPLSVSTPSSGMPHIPSFNANTPSPDPRSWAKVQESFLEVSNERGSTSQGTNSRRERINTQRQLIESGWLRRPGRPERNFSFAEAWAYSSEHDRRGLEKDSLETGRGDRQFS